MHDFEGISGGDPPLPVHWTGEAGRRFAVVLAAALLVASLVFRFLWLDRLPGINGDEAWYGVQAMRCVTGQPWSFQTPSGLPTNPFLFGTETLLLAFLKPSFWVLRLPIAIWSAIGVGLTFWLHRRVLGDGLEALLVATVTACLPVHLAYSRFCWDGSFAFVVFPLLVYPMLAVVRGDRTASMIGLLVLGACLTVWVHLTHVLWVVSGGVVLAWEFRGPLVRAARRLPVTTSLGVGSCAIVLFILLRKSHHTAALAGSASSCLDRFPGNFAGLTQVLLGFRVYEYLSGMPVPGWLKPNYWMFFLVVVLGLLLLYRRGCGSDRVLVLWTAGVLTLLMVAGRWLRMDEASYERYYLYLVPLSGLLLVRLVVVVADGLSATWGRVAVFAGQVMLLVLAGALLVQFWNCYFAPNLSQRYAVRLHRTFWGGEVEPKAALVDAIRQRLVDGERCVILVEDWWLHHAVDYLLGAKGEVLADLGPPGHELRGASFVAGFLGSSFLDRARAAAQHQIREEVWLGGLPARPVLALLVLHTDTETEIDEPR